MSTTQQQQIVTPDYADLAAYLDTLPPETATADELPHVLTCLHCDRPIPSGQLCPECQSLDFCAESHCGLKEIAPGTGYCGLHYINRYGDFTPDYWQ